ncbi:hypothetical protein R3P38DRAFT_2792061 [Favolaschia claudopus]|uniref:F-box domain-containing protein n=1 Tax=Favolaschia claudopus TaxID=2862362 RepID=A0AAW0AGX2_9AGAR
MYEAFVHLQAARQQVKPWKDDGPTASPWLMRSYNDKQLFSLGMESPSLWKAVEDIVRRSLKITEDYELEMYSATELTDMGRRFSRLPNEIKMELVYHTNVRDLTALTLTCKFYWKEGTKVLDRFLSRCFQAIGLDWHSLRFALRHLNAILTGSVIRQMIFVESKEFRIQDFNGIKILANDPGLTNPGASLDQVVLERPNDRSHFQIRIIDSFSEGDIFWRKSTACFTWLGSDGFVVPYQNLSFESKTMLCPPIDDETLKASIVSAQEEGLEIVPFHLDDQTNCQRSYGASDQWGVTTASMRKDNLHNERVRDMMRTLKMQGDFPPEVEENIFVHALSSFVDSVQYDTERGELMCICPRWWQIIKSSPVIWSNVVVHPHMGLQHIQFLLHQVLRSSCNIRLVLDTNAVVLDREPPSARFIAGEQLVDFPVFHPDYGHPGRLQILSLNGVFPTWSKSTVYASLTALHLSNIGYPIHRSTVRALFSASPHLTTLEILNVVFQTRDIDRTAIVAGHLTDLKLALGTNPAINIPAYLVLPALHHLYIECESPHGWTWIAIEGICRTYLRVAQRFTLSVPDIVNVRSKVMDCLERLEAAKHVNLGQCAAGLVDAVSTATSLHSRPRSGREWIVPPATPSTVVSKFLVSSSARAVVYELLQPDTDRAVKYRRWIDATSSRLVSNTGMGY